MSTQAFSSDPSGQSLLPSHSWAWETHRDVPSHNTEGNLQAEGVGAGVGAGVERPVDDRGMVHFKVLTVTGRLMGLDRSCSPKHCRDIF